MPFRTPGPTPYRTHRSHVDRQAINVACHLLLGVVWFERRLATQLVTFAERTDGRRSGACKVPSDA
jgi:hypothetical protein